MERQECGKAHCCFLFAVTSAIDSLITTLLLQWINKYFPFPQIFEPSLCSSLLFWVLRELLKAPIVLNLFPLPSLGLCKKTAA